MTDTTDESPQAESDRFQFGIRQMLVLTAISALAAGVASSLSAPKIFQGIIAAYLIAMAGYVVLRIPHLFRRYNGVAARFKRRRAEMVELAAKKKKQIASGNRPVPRQ